MTKITVLGQTPEKKELKKIEFVRFANEYGEIGKPTSYNNIQLIARNYYDGMDLMAAWDDEADHMREYYLGHFNDGVV